MNQVQEVEDIQLEAFQAIDSKDDIADDGDDDDDYQSLSVDLDTDQNNALGCDAIERIISFYVFKSRRGRNPLPVAEM